MKYIFIIVVASLVTPTFAGSFSAKCQNFTGEHINYVSGKAEPITLNDGTIYEFSYSHAGLGSLRYVIDGTGVIEPKREDRWHNLELIGQTSSYVSAVSIEGAEQIQFNLYPHLESAQIIWVTQPTNTKPEPAILLLKASCKHLNE
ncbi:hypothetical protein [Teredinibacter purpureus]|uniref:hypothetical protein n=1 Tax=Teredinibacter purpureus TaxID=2731756 RepID=UPI0005F837A7|nr:hypothetical protein [Teredinibacter purpureus]